MKKKNIFIAIDTTNLKKAKEIIKESLLAQNFLLALNLG